jgi:hypothetical protein
MGPRAQLATFAVLVPAVLVSTFTLAQGFRRFVPIPQNEPPPTELVVARWRYGTNGWFGHLGWSHNYPSSDRNLNEFIASATGIDVDVLSFKIVDLASDEVFDYPFAYVSEPGEMQLTEQELANLREFVDRGGFILMDDFDGARQLDNMRSQVLQAFPGHSFAAMANTHPLFDVHFALRNLDRMSPYVPGGSITYYGLQDAEGRLAIAAGHNNDLANFWDWYDEARMPLEPAADAFRLGVNFVVWSMTH